MFSQRSVPTHARCGGIHNNLFTAIVPENAWRKKTESWLG